MAAAATSRKDLPPKTPAQTFPPEAHSPLHRSEERKGEGWRVVSRLAGARCEAAERGRGAEQKGGRNLPKGGRGQREVEFLSSSRCEFLSSSRCEFLSSSRSSLSSACWTLVVVSLDARRRLSGLLSSSSLWTSLLVIFSLARSGYTCRGARHEPSDHAGERLGVKGEAQGTTTRSGKSQLPFLFPWGLCKCLWEAPVSVK